MPRIYKRKREIKWTQAGLELALAERLELNTSFGVLSKKFNIPKSTLNSYMKKDITVPGRKSVFTDEQLYDLSNTIAGLADLGFGITRRDIGELVYSYVQFNDHKEGKKRFNFRKNEGYPGPEWIKGFIDKMNLSSKKAITRSRMTKAEFSTNLCNAEVWVKTFSNQNITNGFKKCGIFPFSRETYPKHRFNGILKQQYDEWVEECKPGMTAEEIDLMVNEAKKGDDPSLNNDDGEQSTPVDQADTLTVEIGGRKGKVISFFVPEDDPSAIERISTSVTLLPLSNATFKGMGLKKIDELQTGKRKRVNPMSSIVTGDKEFAVILADANKKEEEEKAKKVKKANKGKEKAEKEKDNKKKTSTKTRKKRIKSRKQIEEDDNDEDDLYKDDERHEHDQQE